MIKFKEKIFFAPIIGKAITSVGGKILSSEAANTVSGVANLASPVVGMGLQTKQTIDAEKQQKEMLRIEKQKALQEKRESQNRMKNNNKLTQQAASNPMAAATAINGGAINGSPQNQAQEQMYSELGGFIHNAGEIAHENGAGKEIVKNAVGAGIGITGAYLMDKAIQRNIRKNNYQLALPEETPEERSARKKRRNKKLLGTLATAGTLTAGAYAAKKNMFGKNVGDVVNKHINKTTMGNIGRTVKNTAKSQFVTDNGKPNLIGIGMTALPLATTAIRYKVTKSQLEDQIKNSQRDDDTEERNYSIVNKIGEVIKKRRKKKKRPEDIIYSNYVRYRHFSIISDYAKDFGNNIKGTWKQFKKAPAKTILDKASSHKGGGGLEGITRVGNSFISKGTANNNKSSVKFGNFIKNNPKTALLGSIGVATGLAKIGSRIGNKLQNVLIDNDSNAFRYSRSGERFVPSEKHEE